LKKEFRGYRGQGIVKLDGRPVKAENRKQESEWVRRILGFNTRFRTPKELYVLGLGF
jgi:hypothetical protein